jgi:hypothetical protein
MEIVEIQDRIGFYDNHVVYILEESEDSFLITTNIPESIFLFVETRDVKKRIPRGEKVDFQTRRGYVTPPSNIPMGLKLEERENELVHDFWKTNPVRRGRRKKKGICLADLS